ncbi:uncharacterized protein C2845_PM02G02500 [Panicum miliaceum]|uniref:Uncharacterized protein n=1 Tax=Panicum miliaceum TaxID=4540 RepID=A0A3L6S4Q9_PANMI|nr:uncharacterized protein C2845_PM02G02500 [Panicum miliaceum]
MSTRGGGGGGRRGGRGEHGGGRGGGGGGRGRGRGAAELGGRSGGAARGGRGGGERGGHSFHGAQPVGGRGGQHYGAAAQGRWQVASPSASSLPAAEVEVLSGEVQRMVVVAEAAEGAASAPTTHEPAAAAQVETEGMPSVQTGQAAQVVGAPAGRLPPASSKALVPRAARPGYGTIGRSEKEYKVTIKDAAKIDLYSLNQFLAGRQRELPQDAIQALDIALRHCSSARYVSISSSFSHKPLDMEVRLAVVWNAGGVTIKVYALHRWDISATAFYKAQPTIDFALEYLNIRDASRRLTDQDRIKLKKALKGVRVVATHRRDISIHYRITGLTSIPLNDLTFDKDGTKVSVVQYFKHQYNYCLKYINWPCLQAGSDSRAIYLPMVVCNILEGQCYSRKLNERQVTSILRMACERPTQRESSILELKYHDSGREKVCNPSIGQWNMNNKQMIGRPCVDIGQVRPDNLEAALRNIHGQSAKVISQQGVTGQQLELLMIVLPDANASVFYGRAKRLCETELGIITQCCLPKNVQKGGQQYLRNLALKINVKVGGRNTVLLDALHRRIHLLTDLPTIIFGADVTHPAAGEDAAPSIAAVIASMDWPEVSKYICLVSSQGHREEIITDLFTQVKDPQKGLVHGGMVRHVGCLITLLFFRDGVSEGQFSQVLLYEMDAIRKGYLPPVTFIVVQKRHHTRLFPENHHARDQTDRSGNILPGTVVDTKICHPSGFDFYLCSHSGIQGTSRPTHYHVLFDENNFTADALQTLTYNHSNEPIVLHLLRTVPPAYYAHLAAFRARHYLDDGLSDQGSSSAASSRLHDHAVLVKQLPKVKDNVQFYC